MKRKSENKRVRERIDERNMKLKCCYLPVTGEKWFDREESEDKKVETDELDGDCCYGE